MTAKLTLEEARLFCGQEGAELMIDTIGRICLRRAGEGQFTPHSIETVTETMASVIGESQMDMGAVRKLRERNTQFTELWKRMREIGRIYDLIQDEMMAIIEAESLHDDPQATNDNDDNAPVAHYG